MTNFAPTVPKKKTLPLMIDLTDDELVKVGEEAGYARGLWERLTARKKKAMTKFGERLKKADAVIHSLSEQLRTKKKETLVEVEDKPDLFGGKMKTYRIDTGEMVQERDLTPGEKQLNLGQAAAMAGQGDGPVAKVIGLAAARDNAQAAERARAEGDVDEAQNAGTPEEAEEIRVRRRYEEVEGACSEGVRTAVANLMTYNTKIVEMTDLENKTFYVAKVDAPGFVMEAEGVTRDAAHYALKTKLLEKYALNEAELAQLTTEQAEDQKRNGPKNLLKPPKGKRAKRMTIADDKGNDLTQPVGESSAVVGDPAPPPPEMCTEDCAIEHPHTEQRVPF